MTSTDTSKGTVRNDMVEWRMRWYPRLILASLVAAVLLGVMMGGGASTATGRLGGDYPAFYGAGSIAVEGDWRHLYEPERQIEAQKDLYPDKEPGQYLYFAYPPFVALGYAPLAMLPYRTSYLVHLLLMVGAVVASIWIAGGRIPLLRRRRALVATLALVFYPLLRSILGGQNSALTLLLLVASWRLVTDRRDLSAGLVLSLLLFKPQYAVPVMLLYLLVGRWKVLAGAGIGAAALYFTSALMLGVDWLLPWWEQVQEFAGIDIPVNGMNNISFIGFAANLTKSTSLVLLFGYLPALAIAVALAFCWLWGRSDGLTEKMALAATGIILISPHTLYYDGALVLFTLGVIEVRTGVNPSRIALIWLLASLQVLADLLGWSPFFFVVLGIGAWASWLLAPGLWDRGSPSKLTDVAH